MNILICDDEALARSRLQRMVEKTELGEVIAQAEHGAQALELIENGIRLPPLYFVPPTMNTRLRRLMCRRWGTC